ncbi:hypothetical protein GKC56_05590 [Neisseriaceae bacterium PsAf]|nr:hypothetical protein [Neisseriaceae bacterium PsAf]
MKSSKILILIVPFLLFQTACNNTPKQEENTQTLDYAITEDVLAKIQKKLSFYQGAISNLSLFLDTNENFLSHANKKGLDSYDTEVLNAAKRTLLSGIKIEDSVVSDSLDNQAMTLVNRIDSILEFGQTPDSKPDKLQWDSKMRQEIKALIGELKVFEKQVESALKNHENESRSLFEATGDMLKIYALDSIKQANNILQLFQTEADFNNKELIATANKEYETLLESQQNLKNSYQEKDKTAIQGKDYATIIAVIDEFIQAYPQMITGDIDTYNDMINILYQLPKNLKL